MKGLESKREYSLSTILLKYLLSFLLAGLLIVMIWTYMSTYGSLQRQQGLNAYLNASNTAYTMDHFSDNLWHSLSEVEFLFGEIRGDTPPAMLKQKIRLAFSHYENSYRLDLLVFVDRFGKASIVRQSPILDFEPSTNLFSGDVSRYINKSHLVHAKMNIGTMCLLVCGKEIVREPLGQVAGVIIGGIVLNDNLPLAQSIVERTRAKTVSILANNEIVCSTSLYSEDLESKIISQDQFIQRISVDSKESTEDLIISRFDYVLSGNDRISFVHVYEDTFHGEVKRAFVRTGVIVLLFIACLVIVLYRGVMREISHSLSYLRGYSEQIDEHVNGPTFVPGMILEFNTIGKTLDTTVGKLGVAKAEVSKKQAELVALMDSIPDLIFYKDIDSLYIGCNKAFANHMSLKQDDIIGKSDFELFSREQAVSFVDCDKRVLKSARPSHSEDQVNPSAHPKPEMVFNVLKTPFVGPDNEVIGLIGIARDITLSKRMEARVIKDEKLEAVGVLAGGIAHDFNNLLTVISGNIELAEEGLLENSSERGLLLEAMKASAKAAKITHQLLTFSKGGEPVKRNASISEIIRDTSGFCVHGSNLSCKYDFSEDLWMIDADGGQISQVIQNLVLNARDAMPTGGDITISCQNVLSESVPLALELKGNRFVKVEIEDSGPGMSQETVGKVFDPYFTTKDTGSGLGLAVCYSIVTKHGGSISVESKAECGTLFTLYLPAVDS